MQTLPFLVTSRICTQGYLKFGLRHTHAALCASLHIYLHLLTPSFSMASKSIGSLRRVRVIVLCVFTLNLEAAGKSVPPACVHRKNEMQQSFTVGCGAWSQKGLFEF